MEIEEKIRIVPTNSSNPPSSSRIVFRDPKYRKLHLL